MSHFGADAPLRGWVQAQYFTYSDSISKCPENLFHHGGCTHFDNIFMYTYDQLFLPSLSLCVEYNNQVSCNNYAVVFVLSVIYIFEAAAPGKKGNQIFGY